jgi:hypothetical protein
MAMNVLPYSPARVFALSRAVTIDLSGNRRKIAAVHCKVDACDAIFRGFTARDSVVALAIGATIVARNYGRQCLNDGVRPRTAIQTILANRARQF